MPKTRKLSNDKRLELEFLEGVQRRCPDDLHVLRALGELYTAVGRYDDGLAADLRLTSMCPGESEAWYNLGCSYALTGRKDDAFHALERAVELGYEDARWMANDDDLASLREDPRFARLVKRVRD